ncbi:MAG: hypothetical protein AB7V56_09370 [Candidatus Nitrosocosmicus sp.]
MTFEQDKPIELDNLRWINLKMTMWSYVVVTGVISVPTIETEKLIPDPTWIYSFCI